MIALYVQVLCYNYIVRVIGAYTGIQISFLYGAPRRCLFYVEGKRDR